MHWTPLIRVVSFSRRSRDTRGPAAPVTVIDTQGRRHPAMAGLNIPPVHGRHCICMRCERDAETVADSAA